MTKSEVRLEILKIVFHWGKEPRHIREHCEELESYVLDALAEEQNPPLPKEPAKPKAR